jgi:hypothetical protein
MKAVFLCSRMRMCVYVYVCMCAYVCILYLLRTILPDEKMSAVVLGSRMRMMTADARYSDYLLYSYKSAQLTCFTRRMRMMTADARHSAYLLYSYKSTNTDVCTQHKKRKRLGLLLV